MKILLLTNGKSQNSQSSSGAGVREESDRKLQISYIFKLELTSVGVQPKEELLDLAQAI